MNEVTTIGLDLAKNVFQIHGVDASGRIVVRRQLRHSQVLPFFETVYEHPKDCPGDYLARKFVITEDFYRSSKLAQGR